MDGSGWVTSEAQGGSTRKIHDNGRTTADAKDGGKKLALNAVESR
jgi:hypothetical protein